MVGVLHRSLGTFFLRLKSLKILSVQLLFGLALVWALQPGGMSGLKPFPLGGQSVMIEEGFSWGFMETRNSPTPQPDLSRGRSGGGSPFPLNRGFLLGDAPWSQSATKGGGLPPPPRIRVQELSWPGRLTGLGRESYLSKEILPDVNPSLKITPGARSLGPAQAQPRGTPNPAKSPKPSPCPSLEPQLAENPGKGKAPVKPLLKQPRNLPQGLSSRNQKPKRIKKTLLLSWTLKDIPRGGKIPLPTPDPPTP
ncbi:uncharacterized protein LOC119569108 [Penaeus monodon]|uniref:uncharacterized protein LOC119569108 n=1 Tax=Penaeus monodon TaxID=6687 RepID=UPI0018A7D70B|nr:uncharacterized protein LOC119569108 [Penaeus monodon]